MTKEKMIDHLETVIATHGWAIQESEPGQTRFAYTVGLDRFAHAEIMIAGNLDTAQMACLLNDLGHLVANGQTFSDWTCSHDVLIGSPIWFREVMPCCVEDFAKAALLRSGSQPVRLLQAIFPDEDGLYPWDDDCHPDCRSQLSHQKTFLPYTLN